MISTQMGTQVGYQQHCVCCRNHQIDRYKMSQSLLIVDSCDWEALDWQRICTGGCHPLKDSASINYMFQTIPLICGMSNFVI